MARIRNNRNICLFCFGDLDEKRVCLSCGKKADDEPASPHQLPRRTLLHNRYLIDKVIGEGGFGITYHAWDVTNATRVAIKEYYPSGYVTRNPRTNAVIVVDKNLASSNRGLKRFIDESQNLKMINNLRGIVSTTDFFSANGTAYIVMEYLDGISLKRYVKRKGRLDCSTVLTILKPVIYSLAKVHEAGLLHRDISPDNILITKNNEVKLIDFGASKHANPEGQSVSIVLKQGFAPEEQYRLHGEQGPWTDVYALGVTIYYCITGQVPPESIQRMYDDTIKPPSELGATISKSQERALMKALAVFAKDRFRSVDELIESLYDADENVRKTLTRERVSSDYVTVPSDEELSSPPVVDVTPEVAAPPDLLPDEPEPVAKTVDAIPDSVIPEPPVSPGGAEHGSYYFPPRDTKVNHSHTADELRAIILGELEKIEEGTPSPVRSEEYPPRTVYVERKYTFEELKSKLLKK